jgi:AAA domain
MDAPESGRTPDAPRYPDPIPGIIPFGSICTFAGASGVGKTALYASWIAQWQAGEPICDHPTNCPTEIGVLVGDRRWQSHRQWLDAAGVADTIKHYSLRDDDSFPWNDLRLWPKISDLFNRALDKLNLKPGSLLLTDPMALWIPGRTNDYKDVAIGLGLIDRLIKPRLLTMLGIFHQSKQIADKSQQYSRPQDKILGSAATIGFSDTAMYLLGPEDLDTPYYGFGWVPHNAKAETFKFTRDIWGLFVPYVDLSDYDNIEVIFEQIPTDTHGLTTGQLLHRLETKGYTISRATVFNCLKKLVLDGRVVQVKRGLYRRAKTS